MKRLVSAKTKTIFETASEVFTQGQHRQIIVEAHPMYALVRLKRQKKSYCVSWETLWRLGARAEADQLVRERLALKKAKRAAAGLVSPYPAAAAYSRNAAARRKARAR